MRWQHLVLALTAATLMTGAHVEAQQIKQRPLAPVQSGDAPVQVRIADEDCRWLARHHPASDVEYKPGVSTTGRPVVPADLGGRPALVLPDVYTFAIGREILGLPGNTKADLAIGTVHLDMTNQQLAFNGQPISAPLENELVALCRERLRKGN